LVGSFVGWFKNRVQLYNMKPTGEVAGANEDTTFRHPNIRKIIEDCGSTRQQIFNVDEVGLFWMEVLPRTYTSKQGNTEPLISPSTVVG
jgi:hypothetical protein